MDASGTRLPPMSGVKRSSPSGWEMVSGGASGICGSSSLLGGMGTESLLLPGGGAAAAASAAGGSSSRAKLGLDESAQFAAAALSGARAQREVDNARGTGVFETYELGLVIVKSSKLYANQRRSNRQLPGGSDSTTAACYMLGGMPDSTLNPLIARISPCDPREERCKAVERVLKDKTRGAICTLNGENPREARADNLAAVRICEVVADILVAYAAKRLISTLQQLCKSNAEKDDTIRELQAQIAKRRRTEGICWCGGRDPRASFVPDGRGELYSNGKNGRGNDDCDGTDTTNGITTAEIIVPNSILAGAGGGGGGNTITHVNPINNSPANTLLQSSCPLPANSIPFPPHSFPTTLDNNSAWQTTSATLPHISASTQTDIAASK